MTTHEPGEHSTIIMPGSRGLSLDGRDRVPVTPRLGGRIGRYRLCLNLANGGMSTVFLARVAGAVGHHRFVALKCLKPALAADPSYVEMFLDEARLASLIDHPNVCGVIDYQAQGSVSYLVMELLLGQSLSAVRRAVAVHSEGLPPAHYAGVVARIIADAAEGLHAAHELTDPQGKSLEVVHRDVSPENVFLTYDGNVKIIDFGVAVTAAQQHNTQPGTLKGKYCYMQPEVLRGGKPDRRADVWGLGVVAWELLTQRRLFEAEHDVDALRAVLDLEIARPSVVRPGIPPALDDIVMRALERDPARRYGTARELGRKLTWFLAEERMAIGMASLADFMDQMFPSGRACARQQLDTVDRLHEAALSPDREDSPTVAGPSPVLDEAVVRSIVDELSGRAATVARRPTSAFAAVVPAEPAAAPPAPAPSAPSRRWAVALPIVGLLVAAGTLFYVQRAGRTAVASPAPAAPPAPAPVAAPATPPPPAPEPTCAPAIDEGAGDLQLTPVRLANGEVVYRIRPVAPAPAPALSAVAPRPRSVVRRPAPPVRSSGRLTPEIQHW